MSQTASPVIRPRRPPPPLPPGPVQIKVSGQEEMVAVVNKLPMGVHMDLPPNHRFTLLGAAFREEKGHGRMQVNGAGITLVPRTYAEAWFKANAELPPVARGLICMASNEASARSQAAELELEPTGLERLDPDNPAPGITARKDD